MKKPLSLSPHRWACVKHSADLRRAWEPKDPGMVVSRHKTRVAALAFRCRGEGVRRLTLAERSNGVLL